MPSNICSIQLVYLRAALGQYLAWDLYRAQRLADQFSESATIELQ